MQAATLPKYAQTTACAASASSSVSGVVNGRQAVSKPAASPRISCHSSWWSALWHGGFKGWHNWLVRTRADDRLGVQDRQNRPRNAAAAIGTALAQAASNKQINAVEFNKLVKDARWYGVDVDEVIQSAFLTTKLDILEKIKSACHGENALRWLVRKIDGKLKQVNDLKAQVKDGIYRSAMRSTEGFLVNGPSQEKFWRGMDRSFDSVGNCHLEEHVAFALSHDGAWKLLPYAELHFKGVATTSRVLEQVCIQAWKNISAAKTVDFTKFTDAELSRFLVLVNHDEVKHHAAACNKERERRAHNLKCEKLTAHLEKRAREIADSSSLTLGVNANSSGDIFFEGLSDKEISCIALRVIVKLKVSDVVEISKLQSDTIGDMWLNEIAKEQLKKPSVSLMDETVLIEYLKSAEGKELNADAFGQVEAEAGKRARKMYQQSYARLQAGLQSDSWNELVRAVLEFSARIKLAAQLDDVSSLDESRAALPVSFAAMMLKLKDYQKIRARNLVLKLRDLDQKEAADHLSSAIQKLRGVKLVGLNTREERFVADVISQHIPDAVSVSKKSATSTGIELGRKFLDLFNDHILEDSSFRKVRNVEGKELPVCEQFVVDQRSSDLQVDGRPVFTQHIPFPHTSDTRRAQEFVKRMRALKGINEEQIMTASRIASQSAGAVMCKLIFEEKLFSLTDDEAVAAKVSRAGQGLMPAGLDHQESFVLNRHGSLMVNLRLFTENAGIWTAERSSPEKDDAISITTKTENSSFSAELRFEIDSKGVIQEVVFGNSVIERADISKVDDDYGKA